MEALPEEWRGSSAHLHVHAYVDHLTSYLFKTELCAEARNCAWMYRPITNSKSIVAPSATALGARQSRHSSKLEVVVGPLTLTLRGERMKAIQKHKKARRTHAIPSEGHAISLFKSPKTAKQTALETGFEPARPKASDSMKRWFKSDSLTTPTLQQRIFSHGHLISIYTDSLIK
jgi:hypothetical protein